jgi:hypothetical protein
MFRASYVLIHFDQTIYTKILIVCQNCVTQAILLTESTVKIPCMICNDWRSFWRKATRQVQNMADLHYEPQIFSTMSESTALYQNFRLYSEGKFVLYFSMHFYGARIVDREAEHTELQPTTAGSNPTSPIWQRFAPRPPFFAVRR